MKQLILLFSVLLLTQMSAANTLPQDDEGLVKAKAKELTKKYASELDLEAAQLDTFEKNLTSYMMKKAKVGKLNVAATDKQVMIKQLNLQENEDMEALLSKGQYKKYLKAKMKLQP